MEKEDVLARLQASKQAFEDRERARDEELHGERRRKEKEDYAAGVRWAEEEADYADLRTIDRWWTAAKNGYGYDPSLLAAPLQSRSEQFLMGVLDVWDRVSGELGDAK
jgi:hypothetical protein